MSKDDIPTLFTLGLAGGAIVLGKLLIWLSSTTSSLLSAVQRAVSKQSKST